MTEKLKDLRTIKNINRNYIYIFLANLHFTHGVWMLYLAYKGLSLFEIGVVQSVFHIVSFTMEIPTGMVADIYGRKTSRVLGRVMAIIRTFIMIFAGNLLWFCIAFAFAALGNNLESGAGDALVYDSMKENGIEDDFMKVKGRQEFFFQISTTISLLVGGYLATLNYGWVYRASLVVGILVFIQALTFVEPKIGKVDKKKGVKKTFINQLVISVKVLKDDRRIAFFIIVTQVFGVLAITTFLYIQNYLKSIGKTEFYIGFILSIGGIIGAIFAANAHHVKEKFNFKVLQVLVSVVGIVGFWGITIDGLTEVAVVVIMVIVTVEFVVISDYINRLIPSEQRATILSFQSMIYSLFTIILFPVIGIIGDSFGLKYSFVVMAIIATVALTILAIKIVTSKNIYNKETM